MDVFNLRDELINDYKKYVTSYLKISDERIRVTVNNAVENGLLWPDPILQLNPLFESGGSIDSLVEEGILHNESKRIFRRNKKDDGAGDVLNLHKHQTDAIRIAKTRKNYVLTTGTGSGKSLAYIIPIVDYILRNPSPGKIKAIIVYPMNALANSQMGELEKFLNFGYPDNKGVISYARYTGQENDEERQQILQSPPDIILTNYVMLELILTRSFEKQIIHHAQDLRFLVLDELHTYRGRQGADVAMLVRRVREALNANEMQCIGTSATIAGVGSFQHQKEEVAKIASLLFGGKVEPENVIGETLRRMTSEADEGSPEFQAKLKEAIDNQTTPNSYEELIASPIAQWIENHLGVKRDPELDRLVRATPISVSGPGGAADLLSIETNVQIEKCKRILESTLMQGYDITNPYTGMPTFAFRLHQFISKGDSVYASLENPKDRYITTRGQQYVPGTREKSLFPLAFCRECGQEYYTIYKQKDRDIGKEVFVSRDFGELKSDRGDAVPGYLFISNTNPWPDDSEQVLDRLPDDMLEATDERIQKKKNQDKYLPVNLQVTPEGTVVGSSQPVTFVPSPFRFCLNCGVSYDPRQRSEFSKLTILSSGGRSTDTTILSISLIQKLKLIEKLKDEAKKLLSFTDNRQDASLQAGHLNDFVEVSLLRSAIYKAVKDAGPDGIQHDELSQKVFDALALDLSLYAKGTAEGFGKKQSEQALKEVLGYRIYRDLKRGWRITSPNLEQCGLLKIDYMGLDDLCKEEETWQESHQCLASASPETRKKILVTLLDHLRRELSIHVDYLEEDYQDRLKQKSSQRLIEPWAIQDYERLEHAYIFMTRRRNPNDPGGFLYITPRSGFGKYLRRHETFPDYQKKITEQDAEDLINDLVSRLQQSGLILEILTSKSDIESPGYLIQADGMIWKAGNGEQAFHDIIRIPNAPEAGLRTNKFFVNFYQSVAYKLVDVRAREHTAQVSSEERIERENDFREAKLPILFCSPTMELGVDIAELNAVNMRNAPPTPANYAQRSGRAGRQGQPALVFTYCTSGNSHDQYYFKHKSQMVSGAVSTPRIDLTNEDLIRSHIHAIWLSIANFDLGKSIKNLLDLTGDQTNLPCTEDVIKILLNEEFRQKAQGRSKKVLSDFLPLLEKSSNWWSETWLPSTLSQLEKQFDSACDRWRDLYRSAKRQQFEANKIINDVTKSSREREEARVLWNEAVNQINLLISEDQVFQSDFYPYRYFASEGFLPGYSFPRLPISAFIPSKKVKAHDKDEYLSRPRFLAISEFGPRSIIYHEGARYVINKVNLPVSAEDGNIPLLGAKQCPNCGYIHPLSGDQLFDTCIFCKTLLDNTLPNLFRMQNVSTKRRDRISSDEEERTRQGFEIVTAYQFSEPGGVVNLKTAKVLKDEIPLLELSYANAGRIWRINKGWRRREDKQKLGFVLDTSRGYWEKNSYEDDALTDTNDPEAKKTERVIPYVTDTKNCLMVKPCAILSVEEMASLQAALKNAIQVLYQLEDNELAAEALPHTNTQKSHPLLRGSRRWRRGPPKDHRRTGCIHKGRPRSAGSLPFRSGYRR